MRSLNWAPAGSATVAMRPYGVSSASARTDPPRVRPRPRGVDVVDLPVHHPVGRHALGQQAGRVHDPGQLELAAGSSWSCSGTHRLSPTTVGLQWNTER